MKKKIILSAVGMALSTALLIISAFLAEYKITDEKTSIILIVFSMILLFIAVFYTAKTELNMYVYECRNCGYTFKPSFKEYLIGAHTLKKRYLKCPECGEKTWCHRKPDKSLS